MRNLAVFTKYTVVWSLSVVVPSAKAHAHLHVRKWIPQKQLLCECPWARAHAHHTVDHRTRLFVTHASYNSLLECAQAGVPMVFVPLFVG